MTFLAASAVCAGHAHTIHTNATANVGKETFGFKTSLVQNLTPARDTANHNIPQPSAEGECIYFSEATSIYDPRGFFSLTDGCKRYYSTTVKIEGDKAYISDIADIYYGDILKKFIVEGHYDAETHTITLPTISLEPNSDDLSNATRVADISVDGTKYSLLLYAGELDEWGQPMPEPELVLDVAEDGRSITPRSPFGLVAYYLDYNTVGAAYDYYTSQRMTLPVDGVSLEVTPGIIDFAGKYLIAGTPVSAEITIINRGSEPAVINVACEGNGLTCGKSTVTIDPCSTSSLTVYLTTDEPGETTGRVTLTGADLMTPIVIPVEATVNARPDYSVLLSADSEPMIFMQSDEYPFAIFHTDDGRKAISTNKGMDTESWFEAIVDVPEGKAGVLRFNGISRTKMPNDFTVTIDGEPVYSVASFTDSTEPYPIKGTATMATGYHTIRFSHTVHNELKTLEGDYANVTLSGLSLTLLEAVEQGCLIAEETLVFPQAFYDGHEVKRETTLTIHNYGLQPVEILGYDGTGGFVTEPEPLWGQTTIYPNMSVTLPVVWTVNATGKAEGSAIVLTDAGEFSILCQGEALPVPADLRKIITDPIFTLDTDAIHPFVYSAEDDALINSSTFVKSDGSIWSWLQADFSVPEGKIGLLDWSAVNDSPEPFVFMGIPYLNTGVQISIDGSDPVEVGGYDKCIDAPTLFTPGELVFTPGDHNVKFTYKINGSLGLENGKARMALKSLTLNVVDNTQFKGYITEDHVNFKGLEHTVGRTGHHMIGIVNLTDDDLALYDVDAVGPFGIRDLAEYAVDNTTPIMIEYYPTKTGMETGSVTLYTNLGDFTVECVGNGIDLGRAPTVYYEGFEYDYMDNWKSIDNGVDGNGWLPFQFFLPAYEPDYMIPYGYQAVGSVCYNYNTYNWFTGIVDHILISPEINLPSDGESNLYFIAMAKAYGENPVELLVGEPGDDIDNYESVKIWDIQSTDNWYEYTADLSAYNGRTVSIAFRHKVEPDTYSNYFVMIDDVLVTSNGTNAISNVDDEASQVVKREYFDLTGARLASPSEGITIEVLHFADGTSKSHKILNSRR